MDLQELKKMIAEEFTAYKKTRKIHEQPAAGGAPKMDMPAPAVSVSDKDVDLEGGDAEDTLKDIYDMLKDFFEGGVDEKDVAEPEGGEDDTEEEEEEEVTENTSGKNAGYKEIKESKRRPRKSNIRALNEAKMARSRFQKLANIKK
jgi:hypothetical protein